MTWTRTALAALALFIVVAGVGWFLDEDDTNGQDAAGGAISEPARPQAGQEGGQAKRNPDAKAPTGSPVSATAPSGEAIKGDLRNILARDLLMSDPAGRGLGDLAAAVGDDARAPSGAPRATATTTTDTTTGIVTAPPPVVSPGPAGSGAPVGPKLSSAVPTDAPPPHPPLSPTPVDSRPTAVGPSAVTPPIPPQPKAPQPQAAQPPASQAPTAQATTVRPEPAKVQPAQPRPSRTEPAPMSPAGGDLPITVSRLSPEEPPVAAVKPKISPPEIRPPETRVPETRVPVTPSPPASVAPAPEPPAPALPEEEVAPATPAKPSAETAPRPESQSRTAQAQRLLGRLGYNAGLPDGVGGPRTQSAIRAFQQANGMRVDGKVSDQLIASLADKVEEQDYRLGSYGRRAGGSAENKSEPGLVTSLFSGLQRLMGREFDSVRQAGELRSYCLTHADTWIYDEGISEFVFCDDVNKGAVGTRGSGGRTR